MHAVVIEWSDGTVVVNGPYADAGIAATAAFYLATCESAEQEMSIRQTGDASWILGDDGQDQIDIYAVRMGEPVNITQLQPGYVDTKGLPSAPGVPCSTCSANPHMAGCPEADRG